MREANHHIWRPCTIFQCQDICVAIMGAGHDPVVPVTPVHPGDEHVMLVEGVYQPPGLLRCIDV